MKKKFVRKELKSRGERWEKERANRRAICRDRLYATISERPESQGRLSKMKRLKSGTMVRGRFCKRAVSDVFQGYTIVEVKPYGTRVYRSRLRYRCCCAPSSTNSSEKETCTVKFLAIIVYFVCSKESLNSTSVIIRNRISLKIRLAKDLFIYLNDCFSWNLIDFFLPFDFTCCVSMLIFFTCEKLVNNNDRIERKKRFFLWYINLINKFKTNKYNSYLIDAIFKTFIFDFFLLIVHKSWIFIEEIKKFQDI